ncbi:hypothetical protein [Halarcobacter bivalviorum]|uniref:DUF3467 domain-containing protein n=1 Tax=Halarcobacter bivalviorum TaxID=663364 RepID=A0AAX2A6J5_9BACT|nr:hypothetical protein [Halarcobacter bivalviorum]AXH12802.1 hypothetical protein ABIV_1812 [Halarcobacter bivalviorum]RXK04413.1 hypothetical protein CRU97_10520 [Halarcobacter bivalviorum]RXK09074.1 hypothetical protein CRV05_12405 [Halarcobacter bivalviorum]
MKTSTKIDSIRLAHHFKKDTINLFYVEKPYGEYSDPVVKIEILENDKLTGQLEIPFENIDNLIESLQKVREKYENDNALDIHEELSANIGGGQ